MHGRLAAAPNDPNSIEGLLSAGTVEVGAEPLDRVASPDQAASKFIGDQLGSAGAWIAWTPPVENKDPQRSGLGDHPRRQRGLGLRVGELEFPVLVVAQDA